VLMESFSPVGSAGSTLAPIGAMRRSWSLQSPNVALLGAMLMPALSQARTAARGAACMSNLRQLGLCLALYANEHRGVFPESLDELLPYTGTGQVFVCPADENPIATAGGLRTSYRYLGGFSMDQLGPDLMIAFDKEGNQAGRRNVLFVDGHVQQLSEDEFQRRLQRDLQSFAPKWDELTAEQRKAVAEFYGAQPALEW